MVVLLWVGSPAAEGPESVSFRSFTLKWMVDLIPVRFGKGFHGLLEGIGGGKAEDLAELFVIGSRLDALVVIKHHLALLPLLLDLHLQGGA